VPIPSWISVYHLEREVEPTDRTALEAVIDDVENEVKRLEAEAEHIMVTEGPESDRLTLIYDCLDELDPGTVSKRAGEILHGLGFNKGMQNKKTKGNYESSNTV
jgi:ATP-binding cassette subfamily F protein 2